MALHHHVPQDRCRALARGEPLPHRTSGAALFADIGGFTALTETLRQRDGERRGIDLLSQQVNALFDALIEQVDALGGSVIGFAGDAITCWFDDGDGPAAERAVQAAVRMQDAMTGFAQLALKVAVSCGPARRFAVGDPEIQRIDALAGATLARVAAGEQLAQPGEVLVDEAAAAAQRWPVIETRSAASGARFAVLDLRQARSALSTQPRHAGAVPSAPGVPGTETLRSWVLPFVFEREAAGHGLLATDLRPATAVFVLLAGADLDDDSHGDGGGLLHTLVSTAQQSMRRHGGVLLELTIGDKGCYLYCNFGAAQVHEDDPARAVRAALHLRQALQGTPCTLQVGISSGTMRVGGHGGRTRSSFGAIGDDVNTAARLMGLAAPGEVLISGRVRQSVAEEFLLQPRPMLPVKGKAEPMAVFAVLRAQQRRAIRLQEPTSSTPIVGRDAELAVLADAVQAALRGEGRVIGLVAGAGMGKSRLVAEGVRLGLAAGFIGYGGSCRLDGIATPYRVWHSIWTAFFDLDPGLPVHRQVRQARAELQRLAPQRADAWPLLAAAMGLEWPDNDFTRALQPKDRKALLEAVLLECLEAAAREAAADGSALLLVLEDLHAADPLSSDLLVTVARASQRLPVLLLLSVRPYVVEGAVPVIRDHYELVAAMPHTTRLKPGPLQPQHVEQVIRAKLAALFPERAGSVPAPLIERITEKAQGNPFYVEELLNDLRDRGLDPRTADAAAWRDMPSSLHSLLLSRIDRLPLRQQLILKVASVIGRQFDTPALLETCPELGSAEQLRLNLDALAGLGLAPHDPAAGAGSHLFKHRVMQEVAYQSMAHATRVELHGRLAEHLLRRHAGELQTHAAELAHHFEQAERDEPAAHHLGVAGAQAAARYANGEALDLLARALQRLPAGAPAPRHALHLQREAILALLGRQAERQAELDAVERLAAGLPDSALALAEAAVRRASLHIDAADHSSAGRCADRALELLRGATGAEARVAAVRVDALQQASRAVFYGGKAAEATPWLHEALGLARQHGYRAGEIKIQSLLGLVHWHTADYATAEACLQDALRLAADSDDARRRLDTLNNLGVIANARGQHALALERFDAASAVARRIGDRHGQGMLLNNMGDVCLALRDFHRASTLAGEAARLFAELHNDVLRATALLNRGDALCGLGQYAAAQEAGLQTLALMRDADHQRGVAIVLNNLGLVALAQGRLDDAVQWGDQALQVSGAIGMPAAETAALLTLARAHTAAGRCGDAQKALEQAASRTPDDGSQVLVLELAAARAACWLVQPAPGAPAQAQQALQPLWPLLLPSADPQRVQLLPMWVLVVAWRTLLALGDARAASVLYTAGATLARRADQIPDLRARGDFMAIAEHRAVLDGLAAQH